MANPSDARPSSTVILARDTAANPELLMVKRHADASFGGAWVFPGGVLDPDDEAAVEQAGTIDAETANSILAVESGGLAYFSAAIRELFEETGVLLAETLPADTGALRASLLDGSVTWTELLASTGLKLDFRKLHYVSFWITPEALAKRYSTRFFVAEASGRFESSACGGEVLDCRWLSAGRALELADAGELNLHFPTRITLEGLARFSDTAELTDWARRQAAHGVSCIFPKLPEKQAVLEAVRAAGSDKAVEAGRAVEAGNPGSRTE